MKRILIALTALGMFAGVFLHANNNNSAPSMLDILTAPNKWVLDGSTAEHFTYMAFTRYESTAKMIIETDTFGGTGLYYLSDTEDTVFDSAKVGKAENGKYMVERLYNGLPDAFEIIEFKDNNSVMVLRYDSKGKNVPAVVYSTWYAQFE